VRSGKSKRGNEEKRQRKTWRRVKRKEKRRAYPSQDLARKEKRGMLRDTHIRAKGGKLSLFQQDDLHANLLEKKRKKEADRLDRGKPWCSQPLVKTCGASFTKRNQYHHKTLSHPSPTRREGMG